jgi:hypothetical protein
VQRAPGIPHALCSQWANDLQNSGSSCRGAVKVCLVFFVIARSEATKQSSSSVVALDCFAPLAMTVEGYRIALLERLFAPHSPRKSSMSHLDQTTAIR